MRFYVRPQAPLRFAGALLLTLLAAVVCAAPSMAASRPAARARHAMIAGPEPIAVAEGLAVLTEGGNAIDAAVTMGFVLAVTQPRAGNLGGGGYMLLRTRDGAAEFIDYRETAPAAASRRMFLDPSGAPVPDASLATYKASGVPGTVAGLALALRMRGTIPLSRALAPAIRLAGKGFPVSRRMAEDLVEHRAKLARWPASRRIFFRGDAPLGERDRLVQEDLAATLTVLSRQGAEAFYAGSVARALAEDMKAHGGLIDMRDLSAYRPIVRMPLSGEYRGHVVLSAPPSSSGGIALIQLLNMLEPHDLTSLGHNSSAGVHLVAEAMKRAFADRSRWVGDPDFEAVPVAGLTSRAYTAFMMRGFDPERTTPAPQAGPGDPLAFESDSTTHFSVVDARGNAVANTFTLNDSFGIGAVAGRLGFLLNNEMDDFSIKPGVPNLYGLVGGEANSIAPGKRMLSSMTPTIVLRRDAGGAAHTYLVLGSPGGPAIITSVLQSLLNVIDHGMELQAAVDAPRFHHQWLPDRIALDRAGFPADVMQGLRRRGHEVLEASP
ncbi:MAG TPA: gamma-glutamyltransferase, partial [Candidatus Polarisedimenticolia bacterium]|nr:gamma-glutamyltransferase [Candidatus Polarisedimenticolia bacterium]